MGKILEFAEALWNEETNTYVYHPFGPPYGIDSIADGIWFNKGVANTIVRETDDGLIIVDPGRFSDSQLTFKAVRSVVQQRLNTAIFTHGHVDHVAGVRQYVDEAKSKGWPHPQVIAQENILARFRRYREMHSLNQIINWRQFWGGEVKYSRPCEFYPPDITYSDRLTITIGGVTVLLRHAWGETDDHTWVFFPDTRLLCTGDLFIWAIPNAGNPQKVQRYARKWAEALCEMADLKPKILAPGHGYPIMGTDRVRQALEDTAALLGSIHEQTVALMNKGASLDTVLSTVKVPEELLKRPYLQPVYDEPEFIVHNIWRLYGGWYDGMPSHLKPASERSQAEEIARLTGGPDKLAARAKELLASGELRLACHLADWAYLATPENPEAREAVQRVYSARAKAETSTFAKGIYTNAAREMGGEVENGMLQDWLFEARNERFKTNLSD